MSTNQINKMIGNIKFFSYRTRGFTVFSHLSYLNNFSFIKFRSGIIASFWSILPHIDIQTLVSPNILHIYLYNNLTQIKMQS